MIRCGAWGYVCVGYVHSSQDSVRLLTVECLVAVASMLAADELKMDLWPLVKTIFDDKSWRVKYMVADKFVEVLALLKSCDWSLY